MKPNLTLATRLTLVFILFALAAISGVGWLSYASGREALRSATISELQATTIEKQAALNAWVQDRQAAVATLAYSLSIRENLETYVAAQPGSAEAQSAHDRLVNELQVFTTQNDFLAFLVIEPSTGRVIAATSKNEEGKFKEDQPFFTNGMNGPYIQNLYYSISLQAPAMTASAPILDSNGRLLGVLAGRLNLQDMNTIINRRSGLRRTDEAFLVNTSNLFVTQPRLAADSAVLQRGVHTVAVNTCLERNSGIVSDLDYRGVPALVAYRWLPERGLCLIVKIDEQEALAPARVLGETITVIGVFILLVAFFLAVGLGRSITRPIRKLQEGAARFGRGELDYRLDIRSADEIGQLACDMTGMANALAQKEGQLRAYAADLEQRVDERTAALREKEHRLSESQRIAHIGSWDLDLAADRATGSEEMYRIHGTTPQKFSHSGQAFYELIHPADRESVRSWLERLLSGVTGEPNEYRAQTPSGEVRHILAFGEVIRDETGLPTHMVGAAQDISERKRAQRELDEANRRAIQEYELLVRRLSALAEQVGLAANLTDVNRALLKFAEESAPVNALFVSLYDEAKEMRTCIYSAGDGEEHDVSQFPPLPLTGSPTSRAITDGRPVLTDDFQAAVHGKPVYNVGLEIDPRLPQSSLSIPMRVLGKIIGVIEVQSVEPAAYHPEHVAPLQMAANLAAIAIQNVELLHSLRDLNADLEQRVSDRTLELQAANKELEAFSYSVSHDLRAPLRAIDGFTRILLEKHIAGLPPEGLRYFNLVRDNAKKMGQLVDDLLAFSRLGRQALKMETVSPLDLVRRVLEELQSDREGRRVDLEIGELPECQADPNLLKQVYLNLIQNAFKFTRGREVARIEIGSLPAGEGRAEGGVYFVKDNGAGFDMRYVDKLFGVFQRLHSADEFEGTGVGLAIVQRIVHRHGGRVWAEAEADKGAAFYFTL